MQTAFPEAQRHLFCYEGGNVYTCLLDHVLTSDAQVHVALADEAWDICCWQEHQGHGVIVDQCYIESVLTTELDVCAREELQALVVEAALLWDGEEHPTF